MAEDERVRRGCEGDGAVRIFFDQDANVGHDRRRAAAELGSEGSACISGIPLHFDMHLLAFVGGLRL